MADYIAFLHCMKIIYQKCWRDVVFLDSENCFEN
jgi:hypothetical protein